jgi:hypothetical protein
MEQIRTKTLAEIYFLQGYLQEAYEIFEYLAEKDPHDGEIQKRLNEIREKLHSSPVSASYPHTNEDKIQHLEKWLENIRRRKKN